MANVSATIGTQLHHRSVVYEWLSLNVATDTPLAVNVSGLTDFTVSTEEVSGGTDYTVAWHVSIDPGAASTSFAAVTDALSGSAISQTTSTATSGCNVDECLQQGLWIKPVVANTGVLNIRVLGRRLLSA